MSNDYGLLQDLKVLWRSGALTFVLARRDVAARYAGSAGGVLWAYAPPLLTVACYFLVFDVVFGMRLGDKAPVERVGTYLIVGMLPWMAFCDALSRAATSLVDAGGLLQKNALPPVVFPARSVLASAAVFAPLMLALVPALASLLYGFVGFARACCAAMVVVLRAGLPGGHLHSGNA
jgi:lipopolysaccharide transport system permease protein